MKTLTQFIHESINDTDIFEQAFNRSKIIKNINVLINQIIENWALLLYIKQYDKDNQNLNHWKSELEAHCQKICNIQLKKSDKEQKYKALYQVIIKDRDLSNSENVYKLLKGKFNKENISDDIRKDISFQISQNLESLINTLSYEYDALEWIENL